MAASVVQTGHRRTLQNFEHAGHSILVGLDDLAIPVVGFLALLNNGRELVCRLDQLIVLLETFGIG